ncbi:VQ motif-containing protein 25 [Abrus precatorius]|uniref:VQ motif-containing protein 25 n=1 Tax=Abrus precatorius TaxID=3816 RepID=A0A8B8L4E0_ABRPR|nr:VQ motif-containing protein 25 [Abrus precatorius]
MENKPSKHDHTHTWKANSHPPSLAMQKSSQTISKTKPKIRIIHIIAPQIIKTDIENFRELVQKITGKPSGQNYCKKKPTIASGTAGMESIHQESTSGKSNSFSGLSNDKPKSMAENMDLRNEGLDHSWERVKEEIELFSDELSCGRYLGGFSELEGFTSEVGEFSLFPLDGTQVQGFEQSQIL